MIAKIKHAWHNPNDAIGRLSKMAGRIVGGRDYRRFIVLGYARTGSNLLIDMLNSHPNIYAEREIFRVLEDRPVGDTLNHIYGTYPPNIRCVGFKIFYYHPMDDESGLVWERLTAMDDLCILHLRRENMLRTIISLKIAENTDVWRVLDTDNPLATAHKRISISAAAIEAGFRDIITHERAALARFPHHALHTVTYEALVNKPEDSYGRILDFLQLPPCTPKIRSVRQNPEPLSALIDNYDALVAHFQHTEWAHFFGESS